MVNEAIIFDLFGTLVPYVGQEEFRASLIPTAEVLGCSLADLELAWSTEEAFVADVTRNISPRNRLALLCDALELPVDEAKITAAVQTRLDAHRQWLSPKPTAVSALTMLRARGYRLGLMSVCSSEVPALWPETVFAGLFDGTLFSCEMGLLKSDDSFYLTTCRQIGANPRKTVYVGDAEDELAEARDLGMLSVLMRTRKPIAWDGPAVHDPLDVVALLDGLMSIQKCESLDGDPAVLQPRS